MAIGTEGNDVLRNDGGSLFDFILALGGDDTINVFPSGGRGFSQFPMVITVDGGAGFDTLTISQAPILGVNPTTVHTGGSAIGTQTFIDYRAVERLVIEGSASFTSPSNSGTWSTGDTIDEINVHAVHNRGVITIFTGGGADRVRLGDVGQGSTIFAGTGADFVDLSGVLAGGAAAFGQAGNDFLIGGPGADLIVGGSGRDTLFGQAGNDVFRFEAATDSTAADQDLIRDFSLGDLIDLSRIDADTATAGDQAFRFIGSAAFGGQAGELRIQDERAPIWLVQGDTNGDGAADFELLIVIVDRHIPTSGDFIL